MDHDETREQLELAAVEPGGLDRLLAGDTPTAQAVAAHLAGCSSCTNEFVRLERASALIGRVVREMPAPALRDRTFATIRTEGVARPFPAAAIAPPVVEAARPPIERTSAPIPEPTPSVAASWAGPSRRWRVAGLIATVAATVLLSVTATTLVVGARVDDQLAAQARTIAALERVTYSTISVTAEPDAQQVVLAGVVDPATAGSLVFSPSTTQLVVVADGLAPPPAGLEYRCWIEVDGTRRRVGRMFFGGDLAYWTGTSPAVSGVSGDATFGVSLVSASSTSLDGPPVLLGGL